MLKIILFISILFSLLFVYIKYLEKNSIFFPIEGVEVNPSVINIPFEDIHLKVSDRVSINGWYIPKDKADFTILFFHGNAGNIGNRLEKIALLRRLDVNIFIIDYRGYGNSTGSPSECGLYSDALRAYKYLINERGLSPDSIILYGESLGGAVAIDLDGIVVINTDDSPS